MLTKSIQTLLEDVRFMSEENYQLVEAIRSLVKKNFENATEELKYGGILFASGVQFCGVFAYKEHVSLEFGSGAKIADPFGHLEGAGKGRRHLKLRALADIEAKRVAQYLPLALAAAQEP